jgi:CheY-like chemotaxis protein
VIGSAGPQPGATPRDTALDAPRSAVYGPDAPSFDPQSRMFSLRKKATLETPTVRSLTIIVADDVAEIQQLMTKWLEEEGHTVACASSGHELIDQVREHAFDLIITDVVMPNGDGLDAILAVSRLRPAARVLAISGGGTAMPADACLRVAKGLGADAVLLKPFSRAQLLDAVRQAMGR